MSTTDQQKITEDELKGGLIVIAFLLTCYDTMDALKIALVCMKIAKT